MKKPTANDLTKHVFEDDLEPLRALHRVGIGQAYKYMQPCCCAECPGDGSGQPSTLHIAEKEIKEGIKIAQRKAVKTGEVPDYSDLRAYATHLPYFLQEQLGEINANGFDSLQSKCARLGKIVSEHADVVQAGIANAPNIQQLTEGEQLLAAVEDWVSCLRSEIAKERRLSTTDSRLRKIRA